MIYIVFHITLDMPLELKIEISKENLEEVKNIFKALANESRIKSLDIISNYEKITLKEFHKKANKMNIYENIETTYRNLEKLVEGDLLIKRYDSDLKKLVYKINEENLEIK